MDIIQPNPQGKSNLISVYLKYIFKHRYDMLSTADNLLLLRASPLKLHSMTMVIYNCDEGYCVYISNNDDGY